MSKWPIRGHFRYLHFKTFPMTPRTPQCEVFWALMSNSKHSGVPEDSKSPTLEVLGFTPTLGQSGVATVPQFQKCIYMKNILIQCILQKRKRKDLHAYIILPTYLSTINIFHNMNYQYDTWHQLLEFIHNFTNGCGVSGCWMNRRPS
jgi:hypothetical protein